MKAIAILFLLLIVPAAGLAHPGRLNSEGCHFVRDDFKYENGKVLKEGSYHCHRSLGKMRLDGSEMLLKGDEVLEDHKGKPVKEKPKKGKS